MITQAGLQDQMLGRVVIEEMPEKEEEKNELVLQGAENKRLLKRIEDRILELLSTEGDLLENQEVVDALDESKRKSNEIEEKQELAARVSMLPLTSSFYAWVFGFSFTLQSCSTDRSGY